MNPSLAAPSRSFVCLIALALLLSGFVPVPAANAQTTSGTLVGTIYDSAGHALANVKVTALNEINGNTRSTVTDAAGTYRIPFLPPGRYTIEASAPGFTNNSLSGFPIP